MMDELRQVRVFEVQWGYTKLAPVNAFLIVAPGLHKAREKVMSRLKKYGIKSNNAILEIREVAIAYS